MTWLSFLALAVTIAVTAWLTGLKPSGTRRIRGTRLMAVARVVLAVLVLLLAGISARACLA